MINNTELGAWLGGKFVRVTTTETYPLVVYFYSGFMNLFVPSAGSKWLIEAPYLLPAAAELGVSATTTVLAYASGDSTTNLIQPFWAIPILTVTGLQFGAVLGYTGIVAIVCMITSIVAMLLIPPTCRDAHRQGLERAGWTEGLDRWSRPLTLLSIQYPLDLVHHPVHPGNQRVVWGIRREVDSIVLQQLVGVARPSG